MTVINKRKTKHGLIDTETKIYLTHRKGEHLFKKFNGFAVSESEIKKAFEYGCVKIRIKVFGKARNSIYEAPLIDINKLQVWYNEGTEKQFIFQLEEELIFRGSEEVEPENIFKGYTEHFKEYVKA